MLLSLASKSLQDTAASVANNVALDPSQVRTLEALSIFRSPASTGYFGKVSGIPEANSIGANPLSASAIEAFIDCEYKFFVTRTLGFYTGERQDTLEIWRAKDFGNLIHNSMEHFLNDLSDRGELPDGKTKFSETQVDSFFKDYLDEELKDFYAKGHDVWRAGFEALMERVRANLRDFFATELSTLRSTDELAVYASELGFGTEEPEKDRTTLDVAGRKSVGLIGRIDRVDLNEDKNSAAVLDFKSGKLRKSDLEKEIIGLLKGLN
jgi:ATP-dependent helicase/DNAse subunit B